jgi:hypothetical protein
VWVKVKSIYDRQPVGQSVLVSGSHLGPMIRFNFISDDYRFLDKDGSVIHLYKCFWTLPEQSLSGPSSAELTAILCCLIWPSFNLEGQVLVFMSPRNRVAQLYPRVLGSLCRHLRLAGLRWRYSISPPHGEGCGCVSCRTWHVVRGQMQPATSFGTVMCSTQYSCIGPHPPLQPSIRHTLLNRNSEHANSHVATTLPISRCY